MASVESSGAPQNSLASDLPQPQGSADDNAANAPAISVLNGAAPLLGGLAALNIEVDESAVCGPDGCL